MDKRPQNKSTPWSMHHRVDRVVYLGCLAPQTLVDPSFENAPRFLVILIEKKTFLQVPNIVRGLQLGDAEETDTVSRVIERVKE